MEKLESNGVGSNGKSSDGFIDRSKVRILLCDSDAKSLEEAFTLLCKCSYQVTSVRSPRQVIDALNAEGPDIDIILAEVDLPTAKGMKMLKYITRDQDLRRIPVIMMSPQDEVSVVVKCLRLGAADYLVKPLRTNELLNLWTHMWRRRRMLGLAEKNILNYDFDSVASDPSDPNTNSTTLLSDDTDDRSKKNANRKMGVSRHQEDESVAAPPTDPSDYPPDVAGIIDHQTGELPSGPKRSEFKIGESSAFFTYVKSSMIRSNSHQVPLLGEIPSQEIRTEEYLEAWGKEVDSVTHGHENGEAWENYSRPDDPPGSNVVPESHSMERSCTPPMALEFPQHRKESESSQTSMRSRNEPRIDDSGFPPHYPCYMPGMVNQVMMTSSSQMYQNNPHDLSNHAPPAMLSQHNQLPQCPPQVVAMASFPYYPLNLCLQLGQMPISHPWPSVMGSPSTKAKVDKVDRREAALIKFRQKRKERCFDKKIRYANRKRLAERRPRVRGQFVRKVNGVNVDLNGQPDVYFNEDEEEEDDEAASRDSFPVDDAKAQQTVIR